MKLKMENKMEEKIFRNGQLIQFAPAEALQKESYIEPTSEETCQGPDSKGRFRFG